ncbi:retrovirus-related pol polyprotein from transposon TNT 1-94 [Tanacetum coccineum]|uniref:Retrovirus-related pol polyprotein from transposon TNT 1-94 n=1 Tax=Tanacetum coccineum TaxID=301880 RepID=A0ABQ4ZPU0_9ASTR
MEAAVNQCSIDKKVLEIQIKQLSIDNDQLLKQIMSQEIVHIAVNFMDSLDVKKSCVNVCNKCLELETELLKKKDLIEKDVYDKLLKSYSTLEKHCISFKLTTQLNQEVFQKNNFCENQNAPTFNQLVELNELKAHVENVKKDIDEIETINIELEHSVAKLLSENENLRKEQEHLKSIYKDQFDTIKKTRVQSKEQCDSLIAQINAKSIANLDLNAQLQEKVFAIAALKNELRKLKGKNVVDYAVSKPIATTIAPKNELLVYASKTCSDSPKLSEKLVAITPLNKDKRVRFADPLTSSSTTQITQDSNKPMLHSTGVNCSTNASGSKPSGRNFTIIRNRCPLARITSNKIVSLKETIIAPVVTPTSGILVYSRRPKATRSIGSNSKVVQIVLWNDHIENIMGYGYYQMGNVTISRVYYVEGLGYNLFCVGHFCYSDLEVTFRKHTYFVRDLEGLELLKGSRGCNLYTLSLENLMLSSTCLLSKASKTKSWLWHRRLCHLNFDYINSLAKQGLVRGLPN